MRKAGVEVPLREAERSRSAALVLRFRLVRVDGPGRARAGAGDGLRQVDPCAHVRPVPPRSSHWAPGATSEPDRGYSEGEVRLAEALGRLVGVAVEGIRAREALGRELDRR